MITAALLALAALSTSSSSSPAQHPPVVLLVLDDVGVDVLPSYGDPSSTACTPFLDSFAASGQRFTRFYTNPVCSPTRAQVLTGRHGNRTGIGAPINPSAPAIVAAGLELSELLLPEQLSLAGYLSAAVGKWHLNGIGDPDTHPNDSGFLYFAGGLAGGIPDYYAWLRTQNGVTAPTTEYATTRTALDAVQAGALGVMSGAPWFLWVSFHAAHDPYHKAPAHLCPGLASCSCSDPTPPITGTPGARRFDYETMVESLDTTIGDLVDLVDTVTGGGAWIFILGDNGTPGPVKTSSLERGAKGSTYEGGIRCPLLVRGPGIVPGVVDDLVVSTDLFATVCELAGVPVPAEAADSISFAPRLLAGVPSSRSVAYCEAFRPNGLPFQPNEWRQAAIETRYKLVRRNGVPDELYDLGAGKELANLLEAPLEPDAAAAHGRLLQVVNNLGR